jgi:hypothetical protein
MRAHPLSHYFQPEGQKQALAAYAAFGDDYPAWSVPTKMLLYEHFRAAFADESSDAIAFGAFTRIYNELKRGFRVFRSSAQVIFWPPRKLYDTLKAEFADCAWGGPLSLPTYSTSQAHAAMMLKLKAMEGLKSNKGYPAMAVSKFLHFYNPSLFPIYDLAVMKDKVFTRFKSDYTAFCKSALLNPRASDSALLGNYLCWAGSLISGTHDAFMPAFVDWLAVEMPPRKFALLGRNTLQKLYATAFEITAIGAAHAEAAQLRGTPIASA